MSKQTDTMIQMPRGGYTDGARAEVARAIGTVMEAIGTEQYAFNNDYHVGGVGVDVMYGRAWEVKGFQVSFYPAWHRNYTREYRRVMVKDGQVNVTALKAKVAEGLEAMKARKESMAEAEARREVEDAARATNAPLVEAARDGLSYRVSLYATANGAEVSATIERDLPVDQAAEFAMKLDALLQEYGA